MQSTLVERLRSSVTQCRALDRSLLLEEAAAEIERLRLTDAEREAVTLALECLRDSPHTALYQTISAAASALRSLLKRTA